jgi:hypothetical protein
MAGAGWWFLYTTQFKPRVQFDIDCRTTLLHPGVHLVEVLLVFENKGFVEHRLYDLSLSIHGLSREAGEVDPGPRSSGRVFDERLFPRTVIVPPRYSWYFIRPGVRQVITHEVLLRTAAPMIEIIAGFSYNRRAEWPHTARRVFTLPGNFEQERTPAPES